MNSALKASIRAVPERTIYVVTGSVAVGGAAIALALAAFTRLSIGVLVGYALVPFLLAMAAWVVLGVLRLRTVGFLPSDADGLIPIRLQPWIRSWLLIRFGLLGSMLLLILAAVVMAILNGPAGRAIGAFVVVVWLRIFLDLIFGTMFNAGVMSSRK